MGKVLLPASEPMDEVAAALSHLTERYDGPLDALDALGSGAIDCVVVDGESGTDTLVERLHRRSGDVPVAVVVDPERPGAGVGIDADVVLDRSDPRQIARWATGAVERHALERGERVAAAAIRRVGIAERALSVSEGNPGWEDGSAPGDGNAGSAFDSRDAVERALVDAVGGTDAYPVGWVARHDPDSGELQPVAAAGVPVTHLGPVRTAETLPEESTDGQPAADRTPGEAVPDAMLADRIAGADGSPVAVEPAGERWGRVDRDRVLIGVQLPATPAGALYFVADRPAGVSAAERRALRRLGGQAGGAIDAATGRADRSAEDGRLRLLADALAHELGNHLGAASIQLDLAAERGDEEQFEHVIRALDRLEELGAETRALARTEPETEPVDLADAATAAWEQLSTPGTTLEVESATVEASPPLLRLALVNLLRNAVEHGATGEPEPGGDGDGVGLGVAALVAERHGWTARATESERGGARFVLASAA